MEGIAGVDGWSILEAEVDAQHKTSYSCRPCPDFAQDGRCVHTRLLKDPDGYPFRAFSLTDDLTSVLFHREGKSVVSHYGRGGNAGEWVCRKHKKGCEHISEAKLNGVFLNLSEQVKEPEPEGARVEGDDESDQTRKLRIPARVMEGSVSCQPVAPPRWARLARDDLTSYALVDPIPSRFGLSDHPRCACGGAPKASAPVEEKDCIVFTSSRAYRARIEVRRCGSCRRCCGPDLRELGLFNYNNSRLYSHELLDSFTSCMANFEAPFHGFCKHVCNTYEERQSPVPFQLINSFACSKCGDSPEVLIFDGVTAGFAVEHCTGTLRPPTAREAEDGPVRANVRPLAEKLTLVTGRLRIEAQNAVRWRMKVGAGNKSQLPAQGRDGGGDIFETVLVDADTDGSAAKA
ncbi:hypothetical protein AURDEDRAFT_173697 [Auricularia subglabra TFB-10046 SS5]|nr:hypothetical protein AURDEDRAFT_173697 [Auricularia subglabra TFB-10046 SS5]